METSDGWERVRKLEPVVVVQSRVRLGEQRNRAKVAVDFSSLFVVVGAGIVEES